MQVSIDDTHCVLKRPIPPRQVEDAHRVESTLAGRRIQDLEWHVASELREQDALTRKIGEQRAEEGDAAARHVEYAGPHANPVPAGEIGTQLRCKRFDVGAEHTLIDGEGHTRTSGPIVDALPDPV